MRPTSPLEPSDTAAQKLSADLLERIATYQRQRPHERTTVIEILDALAFTAAANMRGMPRRDQRQAEERFVECMRETLKDLGDIPPGAIVQPETRRN